MSQLPHHRTRCTWVVLAGIALLMTCLPLFPTRAQAEIDCFPAVDLMLVLDDSGSMGPDHEGNDTDNIRFTAAHLMIDLLEERDRVGFVIFQESVTAQVPPVSLEVKRRDLHERLNARKLVHSFGDTNVLKAVREAVKQFPVRTTGRKRAILLLTDGGETGSSTDLAREANENDVSLYVVALGSKVNGGLLEQLDKELAASDRLGGIWPVQSSSELVDTFLEVLESLKSFYTEPLAPNQATALDDLSTDVRIVGLRTRDAAKSQVEITGAEPVPSRSETSDLPGFIKYQYDIATYLPTPGKSARAMASSERVWKVERPPFQVQFASPLRTDPLAVGEMAEVRVQLLPCAGSHPTELATGVQVLNRGRKREGAEVPLTGLDNPAHQWAGKVPIPRQTGGVILRANAYRNGNRIARVEHRTQTEIKEVWDLEAPSSGLPGDSLKVVVQHRKGGEAVAAAGGEQPPELRAELPDRRSATLELKTAGQSGTWVAYFPVPLDPVSFVTFRLGTQSVTVPLNSIHLTIAPVPDVRWSFLDSVLGLPVSVWLVGKAPGARTELLPDYEVVSGPFLITDPGEWEKSADGFKRRVTLRPIPGPRRYWLALTGLFYAQRIAPTLLEPTKGQHIPADAVSVAWRMNPVFPWYVVIPSCLVTALWAVNRLNSGPKWRVVFRPKRGKPLHLKKYAPGLLGRLFRPYSQTVQITSKIPECSWLPAGAVVEVMPVKSTQYVLRAGRGSVLIHKDRVVPQVILSRQGGEFQVGDAVVKFEFE